MRVILNHLGDENTDGFESRERALAEHGGDDLTEWWGRSDLPMSVANTVRVISRQKVTNDVRLTWEGGDEAVLPNVEIVDVTEADR